MFPSLIVEIMHYTDGTNNDNHQEDNVGIIISMTLTMIMMIMINYDYGKNDSVPVGILDYFLVTCG